MKDEEPNVEITKNCKVSPSSRRVNIITTGAIYLGNFTMGWAMNSFGPLLIRISQKYDAEMQDVALILTIFMTCYMVGALLTNILFKYVNRQLVAAIALAQIAFSMYYTPFGPSLLIIYIIGGGFGMAVGIYDTAQVVWVLEMWQVRAGPFIQAQHFFTAAGSLTSSLVMAIFLADNDDTTGSDVTTAKPDPSTSIPRIPFIIVGVFTTVASASQLLLYIFKPYYPPLRETPIEHKKWWSFGPELKLIILVVIFFAFFLSMDTSTNQFISSFGQFVENPLTESEASLLFTAFLASNVVGKFIGISTILKIPPQFILFVNFLLIIVACIVLLLSNAGSWMLWLGACLLGLGLSTVYASFCGYVKSHLEFTNVVGSMMLVSGSVGGSLYPLALGSLIEANAFVLVYVNLFTVIIIMAVFAIILKFTSIGWSFLKFSQDAKS